MPVMALLTTAAAARELKVGYYKLWRLIRDGKIPAPQRDSAFRYIWRKQDIARARKALK